MTCPNCGNENLRSTAKFCTKCGNKTETFTDESDLFEKPIVYHPKEIQKKEPAIESSKNKRSVENISQEKQPINPVLAEILKKVPYVIGFAVLVFILYHNVLFPDLKEFVSNEGRFSIMMPGVPKQIKKQITNYRIDFIEFRRNRGIVENEVSYFDIPSTNRVTDPDFLLDEFCKGAAEEGSGQIQSQKVITFNFYRGREIEIKLSNPIKGIIRMRVYLAGNRFYAIAAAGTRKYVYSDYSQKFFDSFKLI